MSLAMQTCPACEGFVPHDHTRCPHCEASIISPQALASLAAGAAKTAAAGATLMTLMACYGIGIEPPYDPTSCDEPVTVPDDGFVHGDNTGGEDTLQGSCGGSGTNDQVYRFADAGFLGQNGIVTVLWQADTPVTVYLRDYCVGGSELVCDGGETSGSVEVQVTNYEAVSVVVESTGAYDLQVYFTPCDPNTGCP
ncbi:MAG: hypothetical protein KC731_22750 [Myxococcales bacterium]|nr:hypothetical protein [Myxococcales bacterium]